MFPCMIDSNWVLLAGLGSQETNPINLDPYSERAASKMKNITENITPTTSMNAYSVSA